MEKNVICVVCPKRCAVRIFCDSNKQIIKIIGNRCEKGAKYAESELICPKRILTSSIQTGNAKKPWLAVCTSLPIPKDLLLEGLSEIRRTSVTLPIRSGDVLVKDFLGTGADLIAVDDAE